MCYYYLMRLCTVCQEQKDESAFFYKNKLAGKLHAHCKSCYASKRTLYMKEHYRKYGDQYRLRARERKRVIKKLRQDQLYAYLVDKKCELCGFSDIRTLDFDHIDPLTKKFGIARGIATCYPWEAVMSEIKKCRILCSNCHRIRTAEQQNWRKWRLGGVVTRSSAKAQTPVQFR